MAERESPWRLRGDVVADDAYPGGVRPSKPGHGSENKAPFIAAVELDGDGHPSMRAWMPSPTSRARWCEPVPTTRWTRRLTWSSTGWTALAPRPAGSPPGAIVVGPRNSSELSSFQWANTVIANLKTAMYGADHHFNFAKYRRRYLVEAHYRINRRFDLPSLVGRLL